MRPFRKIVLYPGGVGANPAKKAGECSHVVGKQGHVAPQRSGRKFFQHGGVVSLLRCQTKWK